MFETFLYFLITTVAQLLLTPKQKFDTPRASAIGDFQFPTAEYGRPISVPYGEVYIKGPNTVWYGDLRTEPIVKHQDGGWFSSGTDYTVGYRYYLGAHLVFCTALSPWELEHGSGLVELRFDDKVPLQSRTEHTTDKTANYTTVTLNSPSLFGGDEAEGGVSGEIDFYYGVYNQPENSYLASAWFTETNPSSAVANKFLAGVAYSNAQVAVSGAEPMPAYRGFCSAVFKRTYMGTSNYIKPAAAVIRRFPWPWPELAEGYNINNNANPSAMIVDVLTNTAYGVGLPVSVIGASFKEAAIKLYGEGFGLSMLIDSQTTARDFILEVLRHIDAVIYTDPVTKKIEIKLARADYNVNDIPALNEANIVSLKFTRTTITDTKNVVKVKYTNKANNYQTDVVEFQNTANINATGRKLEDTYEFRGITDAATASKAATRVLKTVSQPLAAVSLTVNRTAVQLTPGAVFKLSWANYGIIDMPCRVTKINYGSLSEPTITIDAVEDVFGTLTTSFITPPGSSWTDPSIVSLTPTDNRLIEAPFHIATAEKRKILTLCSRASAVPLGYKVNTSSDNISYAQTYVASIFTPHALLSNDYNNLDLVDTIGLHVEATSDFNLLATISDAEREAGRNIMLINNEFMAFSTVTATETGYQISGIIRGVFDTIPAQHLANAKVWFPSAGAGLTSSHDYVTDSTVYAKLLPYTASSELALQSATPTSTTLASRAFKPYPPSRLLVNGSYTVAALAEHEHAIITWTHRNKQTQLNSAKIVGHFTQNTEIIRPSDVTYTVNVYINNVLKRTETSLTEPSYTYTDAKYHQDANGVTNPVVIIKVFATNGSYSSQQVQTQQFTMS